MPGFGGTLAVAVPDEPDIGIAGHVVLRTVLAYRRSKYAGSGEILLGGERLRGKHQHQVLRQQPRKIFGGLVIERRAQIDPDDGEAEQFMERHQRVDRHRVRPFGNGDPVTPRS